MKTFQTILHDSGTLKLLLVSMMCRSGWAGRSLGLAGCDSWWEKLVRGVGEEGV